MIRFEELNDKGHYEENEEIFAVRSISNTVSTKVILFLCIPAGAVPRRFTYLIIEKNRFVRCKAGGNML